MKLTGEPVNVPLVAVSVFAPAVVLNVQAGLVATPAVSVVTVVPEASEPEPVPVHVVHREGRNASRKVRAFLDLAIDRLRGQLSLQ